MAQETTTLGEVTVTAQKRTENLQDVPISLQALDTKALEELHVQNFKDYVQMLPSVSMQPGLGAGSGFSAVYMRGIATAGDGQATTSQPSVGMYLDEQPITTIQGNLDIHLYDIARVEALAGPQGTLYGASSEAGTIRIITNKPDASGFAAGYTLEGNIVDGEDGGYVAEGYVNVPINENMAIRLVGWTEHDAGWIDNVHGTRTYPGDISTTADDFTVDNANIAKKNYNTIDTVGARAALRIALNDNWTLTPVVQAQKQDQNGSWGDDLSSFGPGKQAVTHFRDEFSNDKWYQAGLTIEGKIANFDVTYSGNYLTRDVDGSFDYSDYSYWYDVYYTNGGFAAMFHDNAGNRVNPTQTFTNNDHYTKQSHELRISSPQDKRVRGLIGLFWQHQYHDFEQRFGNVTGLADDMLMNSTVNIVNGDANVAQQFPGVVYLNSMDRHDRDKAIFGQLAFDITDSLELTLGARFFEPEVTVKGFFGYGLGFNRSHTPGYGNDNIPGTADDAPEAGEPGDPRNGGDGAYSSSGFAFSRDGEWRCPSQVDYKDAPCLNVDKGISESNHIGRVNLSWKATETAMLYATWSEGYRPGGVQRNPFAGFFNADFLTNYEVGWKTRRHDDRLQFNGAVFLEQWDDFQISFQGANGITQVANGPSAEVRGLEAQIDWLPTEKLRISTSLALYNSKLMDDYTNFDAAGNPTNVLAPKGTKLPVTPNFKGNVVGRYSFGLGNFDAHLQGALSYSGTRRTEMDVAENAIVGDIPASTFLDLSFGIETDKYSVELYVANVTDEDAALGKSTECDADTCGVQTYAIRGQPRTIGIKFSQEF
jgi:outer membrane receptor protein involved in Fe transport